MKKKTTKRATRKTAKRALHVHKRSTSASWDKDRSMILMLAAGTIVLVVIGMFMAGWM